MHVADQTAAHLRAPEAVLRAGRGRSRRPCTPAGRAHAARAGAEGRRARPAGRGDGGVLEDPPGAPAAAIRAGDVASGSSRRAASRRCGPSGDKGTGRAMPPRRGARYPRIRAARRWRARHLSRVQERRNRRRGPEPLPAPLLRALPGLLGPVLVLRARSREAEGPLRLHVREPAALARRAPPLVGSLRRRAAGPPSATTAPIPPIIPTSSASRTTSSRSSGCCRR